MRDFERGAWTAFNEVLGWIGLQGQELIDKKDLHQAVVNMSPPKTFVARGDPILLLIAVLCGAGGLAAAFPDATRSLWLFFSVLGGIGSGVSLGAYLWLP